MKRIFILSIISLLAIGSLLAKEDVLIDFTQLVADTSAEDNNGITALNEATTIDTSNHTANNYTDEQKALMKTSLAIENWLVKISSSSATIQNQSVSKSKEATSAAYGTVLGVRARFPNANWNAAVTVKPPFEIPAYEPAAEGSEAGSKFEGGFGVIKNVGTIKSVAVNVYGLNYPYTLYLILLDGAGKEIPINLGSLNFQGWGELRWDNPRYAQDVRDRQLAFTPIYPQESSLIKFGEFRITKSGEQRGGDFITYFKDVKVIYDQAVLEEERDIDDEAVWQIQTDRENEKNKATQANQSNSLFLQALDKKRQAAESFDQQEGEGEEEEAAEE
ncbi:MAG: flagellar filament outer layer protein FlaA [Treponema sp.]|jgi:hypothetical protein|nr:flagellar filament outer layer protein FlaA [Treponema sp.]